MDLKVKQKLEAFFEDIEMLIVSISSHPTWKSLPRDKSA